MKTIKPKRPSADQTRNKILRAASQLFIQHGFSGTSMGKLAAIANINQSLIHHHFGNKEELWQQVKIMLLADIEIQPVDLKPKNLKVFLTEAITQRLSIYEKRPELTRLISWQRLESKKTYRLKGVATNPLAPDQWLIPIKFLQQKGYIASHLDPQLILVWLVTSINGIIIDDLKIFKNQPNHQEHYIEMIITGLEKALVV